jgi:cytochrome c-type biogenesis protein CcmH/NrfG
MRYLVRAYLNARDYAKAEAWTRKALQHDPEWPLALFMLASILRHQGRIAEGISVREQCERLSPGFVEQHAEWQPYGDPAANAHFHGGVWLLDGKGH